MTKNLEELEQKIAKVEKQIAELKQILEDNGLWSWEAESEWIPTKYRDRLAGDRKR